MGLVGMNWGLGREAGREPCGESPTGERDQQSVRAMQCRVRFISNHAALALRRRRVISDGPIKNGTSNLLQ